MGSGFHNFHNFYNYASLKLIVNPMGSGFENFSYLVHLPFVIPAELVPAQVGSRNPVSRKQESSQLANISVSFSGFPLAREWHLFLWVPACAGMTSLSLDFRYLLTATCFLLAQAQTSQVQDLQAQVYTCESRCGNDICLITHVLKVWSR